MNQHDDPVIKRESPLPDSQACCFGELVEALEFSPVVPAQPDFPPDYFGLVGIKRIIVSPKSSQRGQPQRGDAIHHLLVLRFALFLCPFRGVLLEARDEMLEGPRRYKNCRALNRWALRVHLNAL